MRQDATDLVGQIPDADLEGFLALNQFVMADMKTSGGPDGPEVPIFRVRVHAMLHGLFGRLPQKDKDALWRYVVTGNMPWEADELDGGMDVDEEQPQASGSGKREENIPYDASGQIIAEYDSETGSDTD